MLLFHLFLGEQKLGLWDLLPRKAEVWGLPGYIR